MMTTALRTVIRVGARSEKGLREENQDAMTGFTSPFGSVYLVADGMGGQQGGAEASRMVAECYRKYLTSLPSTLPLREALQRATAATNSEVRLRSQSGDPSVAGMGSTVVMAILSETAQGMRGAIAHIGDSRAYLLRQGQLRRLTRDHSAVQRLIENQQITADEARSHPDANVITRALGQQNDLVIEVSEEPFETADTILLCSDGLSGYVSDQAIAAELTKAGEPERSADSLIALALNSGSGDNITVQVLRLDEQQSPAQRGAAFAPPLPAPAAFNRTPADSRMGPRSIWISSLRYLGAGFLGLFLGMILAGGLLGARLHWNSSLPLVHITRPEPTCQPANKATTQLPPPNPTPGSSLAPGKPNSDKPGTGNGGESGAQGGHTDSNSGHRPHAHGR